MGGWLVGDRCWYWIHQRYRASRARGPTVRHRWPASHRLTLIVAQAASLGYAVHIALQSSNDTINTTFEICACAGSRP